MSKLSTTALALIIAASSSPVGAQATWTYSDFDQDGDLELSQAELEVFGAELFGVWDVDATGDLSEEEFYGGLYSAWDIDQDQYLTEEEYTEGWGNWFRDTHPFLFEDIDADADARLSEAEFARGLGETDLYDEWAGGVDFDRERFTTELFAVYDLDGDNVITVTEYETVTPGWTAAAATAPDTGVSAADPGTLEAEIISLSGWDYDDLYLEGTSAERFIDEMEVYDATLEEVGEVEDLIIGANGEILAVIAEVGGLWDIGDTHVSIPWSEVAMSEVGDGIVVPITEENVGDYGFYEPEVITAEDAATEVVSEVDDVPAGPYAWRASELIGDYARLRDGDGYRNYGYVSDLVLGDGQVEAVVVEPANEYGGGYQAYPWYGYGWNPETPAYDMPYREEEVGELEPFEYDRF